MSDENTVLIDAYSQIFRSFYAVRRLTTSRGEPVNAIMVFTRLLLTLARSYAGSRGAMLFDCGKVDFRLKLLQEYKANRPPMPDDLRRQLPHLREMAAAFGWPLLQFENFEADDLIGGIVAADPHRIWIVSSDKDLSQLIDERVQMLSPASGGGFETRTADDVVRRFGVPPRLIPDFLALVGDSSDNIAGVSGVGPKTAAELLNSFGPIERWLEHPELLAGSRYAAKLSGCGELLRRNLSLVRLRRDLPESWTNLDELLKRQAPDWNEIARLCRFWELRSILRELPPEPTGAPTDDPGDLFSAAKPADRPEPAGAAVQDELF